MHNMLIIKLEHCSMSRRPGAEEQKKEKKERKEERKKEGKEENEPLASIDEILEYGRRRKEE